MTVHLITGVQQEPKRQLRSKETPKINSSLFNFEENTELIDPNTVFYITEEVKGGKVLENEEIIKPIKIKTIMTLVNHSAEDDDTKTRKRSFRRSTSKKVNVNVKDPLNDDLYLTYHRRMEKEEKKMTNRDREKICSEADKMKSQLESLKSNEWQKSLPNITYIRDVRNFKEMSEKRQWTIDSLNLLLSKFEDWKKREDRVLGRNRAHILTNHKLLNDLRLYTKLNKYDYIGNSDTDKEEDDLTNAQIRKRRRKKRTDVFGPVIKIKFNDHVVVAEPFKPTRIDNIN